jgi:hypothetical protein
MYTISVGLGDLCDRLTILEVKIERILNADAQRYLIKEFQITSQQLPSDVRNSTRYKSLRETNALIYQLMELYFTTSMNPAEILSFTQEMIELNMKRSRIKKDIDAFFGSEMREVKSYFYPR